MYNQMISYIQFLYYNQQSRFLALSHPAGMVPTKHANGELVVASSLFLVGDNKILLGACKSMMQLPLSVLCRGPSKVGASPQEMPEV